jgi:hypothetical protein
MPSVNRYVGNLHRCVVPFNSFSEFNKAEGGIRPGRQRDRNGKRRRWPGTSVIPPPAIACDLVELTTVSHYVRTAPLVRFCLARLMAD